MRNASRFFMPENPPAIAFISIFADKDAAKIGCGSAKKSSNEFDLLHSPCTIFASEIINLLLS